MKIRKAFKFQLKRKSNQEELFSKFFGCNRFIWNRGLALNKESYERKSGYLNYTDLANLLTSWKKEEETSFLKEVHSQPLQQALKDLDRAFKDFFKKKRGFPTFKKRGSHDSFRFPQGVKVEGNSVFLPKIGNVRFFKSQEIIGTIKNTTVSKVAGKWFVSFQTEYEVEEPKHASCSSVGVDLGISKFATLSDATIYKPVHSFRTLETKLAREQRILSRKVKFSNNWKHQKTKIAILHHKIANIRKDRLHWVSNRISKNHATIMLENLKISNMSKSAKGTLDNPGSNVKAKSGLNKSILDQGWHEFKRQLEYKQEWLGGSTILVNPQYTSQRCSKCKYVSKENRKTQAIFHCQKCEHKENADINAAKNIEEAGRVLLACGDIKRIAA